MIIKKKMHFNKKNTNLLHLPSDLLGTDLKKKFGKGKKILKQKEGKREDQYILILKRRGMVKQRRRREIEGDRVGKIQV